VPKTDLLEAPIAMSVKHVGPTYGFRACAPNL